MKLDKGQNWHFHPPSCHFFRNRLDWLGCCIHYGRDRISKWSTTHLVIRFFNKRTQTRSDWTAAALWALLTLQTITLGLLTSYDQDIILYTMFFSESCRCSSHSPQKHHAVFIMLIGTIRCSSPQLTFLTPINKVVFLWTSLAPDFYHYASTPHVLLLPQTVRHRVHNTTQIRNPRQSGTRLYVPGRFELN